jgi:pilus assembly protein Flp/PilA
LFDIPYIKDSSMEVKQPMKRNRNTKRKGQSLAEYGLIVALIAVVCIGALRNIGTKASAQLNDIATQIGSTAAAPPAT